MKKRFILRTVLMLFLFFMPFQNGIYAAQVKLEFSADITYSSDFFPEYFDDTFSGYLLYDTNDAISYVYDEEALFEFLYNPASIYVDQLDLSLNVESWRNNYGVGGYGITVDAFPQETSLGEMYLSLDIFNTAGATFFGDRTSLPTDIDQDVVSSGSLQGYIQLSGDYSRDAELSFNILRRSYDWPSPVLNEYNELLIGGDVLASGARINTGDSDLITTKTIVGYAAVGSFVQAGGLHQTNRLEVGGDWDNRLEANGDYSLFDGKLLTNETLIGNYGIGEFRQTGGSHITGWLMLGNLGFESLSYGPEAWGIGIYDLEGGSLVSGEVYIGGSGQGTFNQSGGNFSISDEYTQTSSYSYLSIGNGSSLYNPEDYNIPDNKKRYGIYNLSYGQLTVYGSVTVGAGYNSDYYSYGGLGYFNQSGGASSMHDLLIGESGTKASGEGHVTVSGKSVMNITGTVFVGVGSETAPAKASFEQTGGNVTVNEKIIIGESAEGETANIYRILGGETTALGGVEVGTEEIGIGTAELEVGNNGKLIADVSIKEGGILKGSDGFIVGNVSVDGGILAPGNSPGTMHISGDLSLNDGILSLEALSSGQHDILDVGGSVIFADNIGINILFGYKPEDTFEIEDFFAPGTSFTLEDGFDLTTAVILSFAKDVNLTEGETFNYSLNGEVYQFTYSAPVPIPGALWLLGSGIAGIIGIRRKAK